MSTPEGKISREIQDGLQALGWRTLRLQSGRVKVRGAWMWLCPSGTPDVLAFDRSGRLTWVEVKQPKKDPSPEQVDFRAWALGCGHRHIVARSLDDVLHYIHEEERGL